MSFNVPRTCGIQSVVTGDDSDSSTRYNWLNANKNHQQAIYIIPSHNRFDRQIQFNILNQLGN